MRRLLVYLLVAALAAAATAGGASARHSQGIAKVPMVTVKALSKTTVLVTVKGSGSNWTIYVKALEETGTWPAPPPLKPISITPRPAKTAYDSSGNYTFRLPSLRTDKPRTYRIVYPRRKNSTKICFYSGILRRGTHPDIVKACK